MKIATVAIYVEHQQQALAFWTEKVGFVVHRKESMGLGGDWLEVGPPEGGSSLVIYPRGLVDDWAQRKPSVVFECDDIQATYQQLAGRGVTFTQPPKAMPWGAFAIFLDPEGNWFGLRQALVPAKSK